MSKSASEYAPTAFKLVILVFSLANAVVGVLYAYSDGPYIGFHKDGTLWSARELKSSGGDDYFLIACMLGSYLITVLACLVSLARSKTKNTHLATYTANYCWYLIWLFAVSLDTPISESIELGDSLLKLAVTLPHWFYFGTLLAWICWRTWLRWAGSGKQ